MRKSRLLLVLLILLLLIPTLPVTDAQAADTKFATIGIPLSNGLRGSDNCAKVFYLDLPNGVSALSISTSSLNYSGDNTLVSMALENGKIKVTLKGISKPDTVDVFGYKEKPGIEFTTNIGNSVWLYADGRRWQINNYNEAKDTLDYEIKNASDWTTPSKYPPMTLVSAASNQSTVGRVWYTTNGAVVENQYVVDSTVKPVFVSGSDYLKGEPKFKKGKIITNYVIGPEGSPLINSTYEDQTDAATIPVTGWVEGRFYKATVNYHYTATAKLTTYSYGGTVTFNYKPATEPTLDGTVTVLAPNPNPTSNQGKDIPVSLKINGELLAYNNSSNIEEWVFYAKESGSSTVYTKKNYIKALKSSETFANLVIPKGRVPTGEYEQEYTLTVTVRFSKPIDTLNGSVTTLSQTMKATVGVTDSAGNPPSGGGNKRPVAVLSVPDSVMAGQEFLVYGKDSYDPDGAITDYDYGTGSAVEPVTGPYGFTWYPLSEVGNRRTISLLVTDNDNLSGSTTAKVNINAPRPKAAVKILGTKKENRKITLHDASVNLAEHFPVDSSKTRFTIQAVSGGTAGDIKYSGTLTGVSDKDLVIKKAGTYRATIYVVNNVGYSDTAEITFEIAPDEPPTAYLSVPNQAYRDPEQGNKAAAVLDDMSFSPDYDFIGHRLWQCRYDSDNDGSFSDEAWSTLSDANESRIAFNPAAVGRYEIRLTVTEEFDQPTLEEFVTPADRRSANTDSQSATEKILTVYNRAPVVDWSW
ncbi:hypothetical protein [Paenibacillus glufosinatiresistens]|uniref:hypothetical protein n=1 Tax=Paenibacillus glufosinatiresistens TaxID=3070657 RepID=UPI00286E54C8|nr:hypothetical protein [Paenibacillus sp. YX.27]